MMMPSCTRRGGKCGWKLALYAALLLAAMHSAAGFYEKGSNVQDLKSKKEFRERVLESDHLWAVEFYREGCGYCQLLTPEWEKVAENLKHLVRLGGVNTETARELSSDHADPSNPINGVPTLKLYIPTAVKGKPKVIIYQGERKAKAIITFLTAHMPNFVVQLKHADGSHDRFLADKSKAKVVLVTEKPETTSMFKALASEYRGRVLIGEVRKSERNVFAQYGPDKLPAFLQLMEDPASGMLLAMTAHDFTRPNAKSFNKLSNFVWDAEREFKKIKKRHAERQAEAAAGGKTSSQGSSKKSGKGGEL
ncbi:thioredoxin-like protein [Baffinella frigidus]|nr:thioredoxin-like protein [Cryptophyta sp. CCMP2293]